jgi:hypothetical protein
MEFLLSILSSIIGNLLNPDLKKWMGLKFDVNTSEPLPLINDLVDQTDHYALEQRRALMRRKREVMSWTVMVYFTLFLFVGVALGLPLAFKTQFFSKPLECSAILLASACGGHYWQPQAVEALLALLIVLFSVVIFVFSQFLASPIASYIHLNHNARRPNLLPAHS